MSEATLPNEMSEELSGIHGLNFSFPNNSSSRSVMFASHFSQRLVINGSTPKIIQTGMEYEMAKYTFDVKMPADGTILKIIQRYPKTMDIDSISFSPEMLVIYEDMQTQEIGAFMIPNYKSFHQYFGFAYVHTPNMGRLIPGNFIEKGAVFAHSNAVTPYGGYNYGVSMNMAFMSHPAVSEDGVLISESALKKLEFSIYETRVMEFGGNVMPLNIYGTTENYQCFPEIGQMIADNGVLMVLRKLDPENAPSELSIYDTMEPDYTFDTAYYARGPGGRVVDITVYHDDNAVSKLPEQVTSNFSKYIKGLRSYYQEVIRTEQDIRRERVKKFGVDNTVLSPYLHRIIVEGLAILDPAQKKHGKKLNLIYRRAPLPEFRVAITVEYKIRPDIGFKLTDSSGGKGVICHIEKDENMPVDAEGNRAEVIMDSGSTINRMNLSRLYEQYLGSAARDVRKALQKMAKYRGELPESTLKLLQALPAQTVDQMRSYLLGFFSLISEKQATFFSQLGAQELLVYLRDVLCDELFLFFPIDNPKELTQIISDVQKHYPPCYSPVTYAGYSGQKVTTERNVRIGPLYLMLLEKIADDGSAVSYGKMQHFGVLSMMTKSEKYTFPYRNNPVRTIGETEGRVFVGYCGQHAVAEMMDRANSPATQKSMVWNILDAKQPTNIPYVVDRTVVSYGGSKPLALVNHIFTTAGFKLVYEPENRP